MKQARAYDKLLTLSRMSAHANEGERHILRKQFDTTLRKGFDIRAGFASNPGGTWTGSGQHVNGFSGVLDERSAMTISTYFACIRNIAEDCAKLPLKLFSKEIIKNRPVSTQITDALSYILSVAPNDRITAFDYWSTMFQWAVGIGGAFAEKEFNRSGELIALYPIHPSRVQIILKKDQTFKFKVYNNDGSYSEIPESNMFYFFGMSIDGYVGYSVVQLMQNTLSRSNSTDRYARHFFTNNGRPTGALVTDETLSPQARRNLQRSWQEQYEGPMNAGKTAVLESGVKYAPFSAPFKDLEFVAQWKHNQLQICEWFRMPPRKVGVESTAKGWATIDAEETEYLTSCLMPWLLRAEQNIRRQLMPRWKYPDNVNPSFDCSFILRGDITTRVEMNNSALAGGWKTPNEVRESEGMNPIDNPSMDKTFIQAGFVPIELAGKVQAQAPKGQSGDNQND